MKVRLTLFVPIVLLFGLQPILGVAQSQNRSVREVQQALAAKGYELGTVDGIWGKKSVAALKSFQQSRGLPATGVVDDRVNRELFPTVAVPVQAPFQLSAPVMRKVNRPGAVQVSPALPAAPTTVEAKPEPTAISQPIPRPQQAVQTTALSTATSSAPAAPADSVGVGLAEVAFGLLIAAFLWRKNRKKSQGIRQSRGETPDQFQIPSQLDTFEMLPTSNPRAEPLFRQSLDIHNARVIEFVKANNLADQNEEPSVEVKKPVAQATSQAVSPPKAESAFRQSLDAHNASVIAFVKANVLSADADDLTPSAQKPLQTEMRPLSMVTPEVTSRVTAADAKKLAQAGRPFFGNPRRLQENAKQLPPNHAGWVPAGSSITVGGITITRGMIYTGTHLGRQGASYENENCLINPKLNVSKAGDPHGTTMGYWPSYSQISSEARRSYLEWLAGPRSDPATYIGYVFLYFYGLERRLMLEENASDADDVSKEVRRLLGVYGFNHSFNRYAQELLSTHELKAHPQDAGTIPDAEGNGFEVPASIKIALGMRVRDGKPIEPRLLFKYARTHPETRVRTPARRAPELLEALFVEQVAAAHPNGFRVSGSRFKTLKSTYRACSGSFVVDVAALGGSVPDITEGAEPIGMARSIFEKCSDDLDEYSRALGRSPGLKMTFAAVSKLPKSLRNKAIDGVSGKPLSRLASLATGQQLESVRHLAEIVDLDLGTSVGKSKLRELSQLLAAFGFGHTADPGFALKQAGADDPVLIFRLNSAEREEVASDAYRSAQLSVMLGMVVGHADGSFDKTEKQSLINQIDASSSLSTDERLRLKAEVSLIEADPAKLNEWTKKLKDVPPSARSTLAAELVAIAGADGTVHAAEVKTLEGLFKKMGLDPQSLYTLLHESGSNRKDDEPTFIIEATEGPAGLPIPPESKKNLRPLIDLSRLNAIRNETRATASVLADIFVEEVEIVEPPPIITDDISPDDEMFDGLQQRYHSLVIELREHESWTANDFENLVRAAGLMPGAARNAVNEWAMDRFDELLIEGDGPYVINSYLLPPILPNLTSVPNESVYA